MCDFIGLRFEILVKFGFCFPAVTVFSVIVSLGYAVFLREIQPF